MDTATLLLFLPACFALNLAPGPNNLLSLRNASQQGLRKACLAGVGRLLAFTVMIALAATGLAAILQTSELAFSVIKTVGALYLFVLAVRFWLARPSSLGDASGAAQVSLIALARQEFAVAAGNPKAILIFTAFLPQFVDPGRPLAVQFAVLGLIFLVLEWVAIGIYGYVGLTLGQWFQRPASQRLFNRTCGSLMALAGAGLLMARKQA
jgi:threonine/homoserine/homoserine lactone efflux protein